MKNDLHPLIQAFKVAGYLSPFKINQLKPTATGIDGSATFPIFRQANDQWSKTGTPQISC